MTTVTTSFRFCLLTLLLLLAAAPLPASARLGETPEQCAARYGAPAKPLEPLLTKDPRTRDQIPDAFTGVYLKNGVMIEALFYKGKCVQIAFCREDRPLEEYELRIFVDANVKDAMLKKTELRPVPASQLPAAQPVWPAPPAPSGATPPAPPGAPRVAPPAAPPLSSRTRVLLPPSSLYTSPYTLESKDVTGEFGVRGGVRLTYTSWPETLDALKEKVQRDREQIVRDSLKDF